MPLFNGPTAEVRTLRGGKNVLVGRIALRDGRPAVAPQDDPLLETILTGPTIEPHTFRKLTAESDPEAWLYSLEANYASPYLCVSLIGKPELPKQRNPVVKTLTGYGIKDKTQHRKEGEVWKGPSGHWFTLKDGHVVPHKDPGAAQNAPRAAPQKPPAPGSHDAAEANDHYMDEVMPRLDAMVDEAVRAKLPEWDELPQETKEKLAEKYVEYNSQNDVQSKQEALRNFNDLTDEEKYDLSFLWVGSPRSRRDQDSQLKTPSRWEVFKGGRDYTLTGKVARFIQNKRTAELLAERGLSKQDDIAEELSDTVWNEWKESSTSYGGLLLQKAVAEELGGHFRMPDGEETSFEDAHEWADRHLSSHSLEKMRCHVRATWEACQYVMRKAGIENTTVWRGLKFPRQEVERGGQVEVAEYTKLPNIQLKKNGCASCTSNAKVANEWRGDDPIPNAVRIVLRIEAPRSAVLALPCLGENHEHEQEVVLTGTMWNGWDAWLDKAPDRDASDPNFPMEGVAGKLKGKALPGDRGRDIVIDFLVLDWGKPHWLSKVGEQEQSVEEETTEEPTPPNIKPAAFPSAAKSLDRFAVKAGVTEEITDKLGRKECYRDGVHVPCPERPSVRPTGETHQDHYYKPDLSAKNPRTGVAEYARVGVPAMSVPPPPDAIPKLPNLSKKQRRVEERFAEAYLADPERMVRKYLKALRKGKVGAAPNVFATDDVKALNPDWNPSAIGTGEKLDKVTKRAMALYNTAVHQTANAIAKKAFVEYLDAVVAKYPYGDPRRSVLVTNGGCASGKGSLLSHVDDPDSPYNKLAPGAAQVGAVWDAAGEQLATENPWIYEECYKRGIKMICTYVWAEPRDTWDSPVRGVIRRAIRKGRMVDARLFADSYAVGARNMSDFVKNYRGRPGLEFIFVDNRTKERPKVIPDFPKQTLRWDAEDIYADAIMDLEGHRRDLDPAVLRGGMNGVEIWGPPSD